MKKETTKKKTTKKKVPECSDIYFYDENLKTEGTIRIYKNKNKADGCIINIGSFCIYAHILETDEGYFVSYPSYKNKNGDYKNVAYCFDSDTINNINNALFDYYESEED